MSGESSPDKKQDHEQPNKTESSSRLKIVTTPPPIQEDASAEEIFENGHANVKEEEEEEDQEDKMNKSNVDKVQTRPLPEPPKTK